MGTHFIIFIITLWPFAIPNKNKRRGAWTNPNNNTPQAS